MTQNITNWFRHNLCMQEHVGNTQQYYYRIIKLNTQAVEPLHIDKDIDE